MSSPLFIPLKRLYHVLARFPIVRSAREWWRSRFQARYWPWYNRRPTKSGIASSVPGRPDLIVTLTSFPARMHLAPLAIRSLLRQSLKPQRVVLWLGEDKFPNKEANLPKELLELEPFGLEIRWARDVGAFTKLAHSLREWPDAILVTADDDTHYPRKWLESLYRSYLANPRCIHTGVVHQIAFDKDGNPLPFDKWSLWHLSSKPLFRNVHNGSSGTLYPPHCLHPDVLNTEAFYKLSFSADDFWTWAMAVRAGTKIQLVQEDRQQLAWNPDVLETPTLWQQNTKGGGNTRCFFNLLQAYPEITETLRAERVIPD